MKVALCFSGSVRTFEECYPSYNEILSKYECHLFGAAPPCKKLPDYPFKKLLLQADEYIDERNYAQCKNEETAIQNTLRQFYFIYLCNQLRAQYEQEKGIHYDWVIRTRFDGLLIGKMPDFEACNPANIYIPDGHDHPFAIPGRGINDRFAFGTGPVMDVYCNKWLLIDDYMKEGRRFHPESMLKWAIDRAGVPIFRFPDYVRVNRGNNELL